MENQIAALNNLGIALLREYQFCQSEIMFRKALQLALLQLDEPTPSNNDEDTTICRTAGINSTTTVSDVTSSPTGNMTHEMEQLMLARHLENDNSISPFVHPHGISILPVNAANVTGADWRNCLITNTISSCTLLFNLGLVYHIKGLSPHCSSNINKKYNSNLHFIKSAYKFYKLCYSLIHKTEISNFGSTGHVGLDLLIMALLNNMVQIGVEHNDVIDDSGEMCLHYMNELARVSSDVSPVNGLGTPSLINQQKSKFLLNAMMFLEIVPATIVAPAA